MVFHRRGLFGGDPISVQLERVRGFPLPFRILASPRTTVALSTILGGLTGGLSLIPRAFLGSTALVTAPQFIETFPSFSRTLVDPERRIEEIAGIPDIPRRIVETFREKKEKVREAVADIPIAPVVTAGVVGGLAIEGARRFIGRDRPTELERQQQAPTLAPLLPEVPTPIGAENLPAPVSEEEQAINIDIDVRPEINVKPRKSEIFINNIIQSI